MLSCGFQLFPRVMQGPSLLGSPLRWKPLFPLPHSPLWDTELPLNAEGGTWLFPQAPAGVSSFPEKHPANLTPSLGLGVQWRDVSCYVAGPILLQPFPSSRTGMRLHLTGTARQERSAEHSRALKRRDTALFTFWWWERGEDGSVASGVWETAWPPW